MKYHYKIAILLFIVFLFPLYSFTDEPIVAKRPLYNAYIACSDVELPYLSKKIFDSLIAMPLCAKDSLMNTYPIQSFEINYAERGLYQDSAGLPIIFTDYSSVQCKGNSIPKEWVNIFNERSYKGDTIYIDNIKVLGAENRSFGCKGLKIIIKE